MRSPQLALEVTLPLSKPHRAFDPSQGLVNLPTKLGIERPLLTITENDKGPSLRSIYFDVRYLGPETAISVWLPCVELASTQIDGDSLEGSRPIHLAVPHGT